MPSEIEVLVGLHMAMGVLGFPRVRMYRSSTIKTMEFSGIPLERKKNKSDSASASPHDVAGQKRVAMERRPVLEVQTDMVDHMLNYDGEKEATRCKLPGCSGKTHVFCEKCKVHYCFVLQRNCFKDAHRK